jgi:hypothetical protein
VSLIDDLDLLMEVVAVGFSDRELLSGAEIELVSFDLADGAEVDDI